MASRDPAFLWETEVLRASERQARARHSEPGDITIEDAGDWLTLKEASETTGVPVSTIRKWARHENIPSFLERTADGYLRVVSMSGIQAWTDRIGRDIDHESAEDSAKGEAEDTEIDLTTDEPEVPEGSMLVPLDAWNRMLNQLGNLHEAGQQLADARERAAKAETEARFLKERLADLREELEKATATSAETEPGASQPETESSAAASGMSGLIKQTYRGWRDNRRNRR